MESTPKSSEDDFWDCDMDVSSQSQSSQSSCSTPILQTCVQAGLQAGVEAGGQSENAKLSLKEQFLQRSKCVIVQKAFSVYDDLSYSDDGWSSGSAVSSPANSSQPLHPPQQETTPYLLFDESTFQDGKFKSHLYGSSTRWSEKGDVGVRTLMLTIKIDDLQFSILWPLADQLHFLERPHVRLVREQLFYIQDGQDGDQNNDDDYLVRILCRDLHRFALPAAQTPRRQARNRPPRPDYQVEISSIEVWKVFNAINQ